MKKMIACESAVGTVPSYLKWDGDWKKFIGILIEEFKNPGKGYGWTGSILRLLPNTNWTIEEETDDGVTVLFPGFGVEKEVYRLYLQKYGDTIKYKFQAFREDGIIGR